MLKHAQILAGVLALLVSGSALAVPIISGSLDNTDPTWNGCGSGTGCFYDSFQFGVDTTGSYTFTGEYAGVVPTTNLDGILEIYMNAFNAATPGVGAIAFDDDYSNTGGFPSCTGSNCSQIAGVNLTAGTSYFMVVSSFTNVANSFGQPTGPWALDGSGPGRITIGQPEPIPEPSVLFLMSIGLTGLALARRRQKRLA